MLMKKKKKFSKPKFCATKCILIQYRSNFAIHQAAFTFDIKPILRGEFFKAFFTGKGNKNASLFNF